MRVNGNPRRKHSVTRISGGTRIEIEQPGDPGLWRVDLTVKRIGDAVDLRIFDSLVVELTPQEARDLAQALGQVADG
ncbi:hypothetical protein [Bosea sp. 685]|uniref:hypothetical protein n=1 Tax=Bosea sp. 685 TaxID=3080057 RepID=UPI0028937A0D|nr:hypothetical protein [Bosea sp. 685]WNJ89184.1 hypothetical protein RMR04_22600 [Bosea sp. 685]